MNKVPKIDAAVMPRRPQSPADRARNLGSALLNQMYDGVDMASSSLLHGEYDPEDVDDVDPVCDMHTDMHELAMRPVEKSPATSAAAATSAADPAPSESVTE